MRLRWMVPAGTVCVAMSACAGDSGGDFAQSPPSVVQSPPTVPSISNVDQLPSLESGPVNSSSGESEVAVINPDLAKLFLLLDIGTLSEEAIFLAHERNYAGITECLRDAGFNDVPVVAGEPVEDLKLGLSDIDFAAKYGFGYAADALGEMPPPVAWSSDRTGGSAYGNYLAEFDSAQRAAFEDVYVDCEQENSQPYNPAYGPALEEFESRVLSDERMVQATHDWSDCMAAVGHDYADPWDMRNKLLAGDPSSDELRELKKIEIQVAIANVDCEPAYIEVFRSVAEDRYEEFTELLDTVVVDPNAVQG